DVDAPRPRTGDHFQWRRADGNRGELVLVADVSEVLEIPLTRRSTRPKPDLDTFEQRLPPMEARWPAAMKGGEDHGEPRDPKLDHKGADADRQVREGGAQTPSHAR